MSDSDPTTRLNAALSGRYRIERELGEGGMAMVYLADDLKHGRKVALKVLKPELAAAVGAERFLAEIKTTANLQHPHILPLFDSGEADGFLFYVMPYVEGETLREKLEREKELPVDEAVRIGTEVAHALAYAHAAGIVHRDIKPANILLSSGQAVVADFGIARATEVALDLRLTGTGVSPGTPLYMSPEQATGEHDVGPTSDLYALGCVVYEMLTGHRPHEGRTVQAIAINQITKAVRPIRDTRDTVPIPVDRAVLRALAILPADRFTDAEQFAAALDWKTDPYLSLADLQAPRRPRAWGIRAAAVLLVALAGTLVVTRSGQGLDFVERDWIVIADLENHTGDEVFDRSLNTALTVALDQSRYVNVYPRQRVQETLARMGQDSVSRFTPALAREVAIRENLKAVLEFEISNLDDSYSVTIRVVVPETGVSVYSETARAQGKNAVIEAVDELALGLRSDLGESLASIEAQSTPLPQATTFSLEALKRHADGSHLWGQSRWEEARTLWGEAVALDSSFAWAHASLGLAANWIDGFGSGQPHFDRALALLDRVTEKERLWIRSLAETGEPMVETLRIYTQLYPDDRDAWYNLGNGYRTLGRLEEGIDAYNHSIALDSMAPWPYINSAIANDDLGGYEEAVASFERAFELDPPLETQTRGDLNRISGFVLAKVGDTASARERFELLVSRGGGDRANGLRSLGLLDMYRGRMGSAIERLEESVVITEATDAALSEYRNRLYLASALDAGGLPSRARSERNEALEIAAEIRPGAFWLVILVKQLARGGAPDRAEQALDLVGPSVDEIANDNIRATLEQMRGEIALARGELEEATIALERANGLWPSLDRKESMAYGHLLAGRNEEARAAFEDVLSVKPFGFEPQAYWLAAHVHLGHANEALGETDRASERYRRLLELWGDGDPDLPWLLEARERLEALRN